MAKTGMMDQYMAIKAENPDTVLFFRMGDFYEMFHEDAVIGSEVMGLSLTSRDKKAAEPIPMAGFPWHALEGHLRKMLAAGHKVTVVEQSEPRAGSKLMNRNVTRIYTPGSLYEESLIGGEESALLASLVMSGESLACALIDNSTGHAQAFELEGEDRWSRLLDEMLRNSPRELVLGRKEAEEPIVGQLIGQMHGIVVSQHEVPAKSRLKALQEGFGGIDLGHLDLDQHPLAMQAVGLAADYLCRLHLSERIPIRDIEFLEEEGSMVLDQTTLRNLELTSTLSGEKQGSLFHALDCTRTWMGRRRLKSWLLRPSTDINAIEKRLDAISSMVKTARRTAEVREHLKGLRDMERLARQLVHGRSNGRDIVAIANCLSRMPAIQHSIEQYSDTMLLSLASGLNELESVFQVIQQALVDEQPLTIKEGGMFRSGWNDELDELRSKSEQGNEWIRQYEAAQREELDIPSLKVRFNRQIGWYIEVTKTHLSKVPENYLRRQSMTNAQRYSTEELRQWEDVIINADSRCNDLEYRLFCELRSQVMQDAEKLAEIASKVAIIDVLASLAHVSRSRGWKRPALGNDIRLEITDGRHPVLDMEDGFIANDTMFNKDRRFILLTGPNMGGKSTYLRQTALITILAQMGCFVPAKKARIGVVDRIFTRVGASDDINRGRSTFMMEMLEVAHILRRATSRSLLLLDEVGRGTSTFDGLSIAWAVSEDIVCRLGSRALFATHYHQLVGLEEEVDGLANVHVQVAQTKSGLRFLHRVAEGASDDSLGVQVAGLAGLPEHVVDRARDLLIFLEKQAAGARAGEGGPERRQQGQKSIMGWMLPQGADIDAVVSQVQETGISESQSKALEHLENIEPDHLSPKEALDELYRLRDIIQGRHELMQE